MEQQQVMRVVVIDDDRLFLLGLCEILKQEDNIKVVGMTSDSLEGIRLVNALNPTAVLLDLRMPVMNGLMVLRKLRSDGFDNNIIMLTASNNESDLVDALRNGAQGYLLKDMEFDSLLKALGDIVNGSTVIATELTGVLARIVKGDSIVGKSSPFDKLTVRETEVACHIAQAKSNKDIARSLNISDGTVKLHVKAVLRKLSVNSRAAAAVMAVKAGLCKQTVEA